MQLQQAALLGCVIFFGLSIGSFLNVCIYRIPRNLSVNDPARSFCPHCEKRIPWYLNIPLFSWIFLRGKCSFCKNPISFRYVIVELLTGILFGSIWVQFTWEVALVYCLFVSLLIVASFIDAEYYIIPDRISIGGTVLGFIAAFFVPQIVGQESSLQGFFWSFCAAFLGFLLLFGVVEIGKILFGRKKEVFAKPLPWKVKEVEDDIVLEVGGETLAWSEIFYRKKDHIVLDCRHVYVNGKEFPSAKVKIYEQVVYVGEKKWEMEKVETLQGITKSVVIPREAMGFGDVKFIAMIGAFLGWKAIIFTIFTASVTGSVLALIAGLLGKRDLAVRIPFGPYLAFGALLWMFSGPTLVEWYFSLLSRGKEMF